MNARSQLRSTARTSVLFLLGLAVAACGGGDQEASQQGQPAGEAAPGGGQQEQVLPSQGQGQGGQPGQPQLIMQFRQVSQRLQRIRQQALQDSGLQARRDSVVQIIRSTMRERSDSTAARMDRMDELGQEMQTARQEQDTARIQQIQGEARSLNRLLRRAQQQVMQQPEVRKQVEAFQQAVRERMRQVDPAADSLLSLSDSLRARLQQQMGGGTAPGGSGPGG